MNIPERPRYVPLIKSGGWLYDYEWCADEAALAQRLDDINRRGYQLVSVTGRCDGSYMVFFGRPKNG